MVGSMSGSPVVRDFFRHDFFRKGRRDLLAQIRKKKGHPGGSKKFDCQEEVQALQAKLATLENRHTEMVQTIKDLQASMQERLNTQSLPNISRTDPAVERLENRLNYIEDHVFTLLSQRQSRPHANSWPDESGTQLAPNQQYAGGAQLDHLTMSDPPLSVSPTNAASLPPTNVARLPPGMAVRGLGQTRETFAMAYQGQPRAPLNRETTEDTWCIKLEGIADVMDED